MLEIIDTVRTAEKGGDELDDDGDGGGGVACIGK